MTSTSRARVAIIDAGALRHRLETGSDCRVLDVRAPVEFGEAHIQGAYNVPLETLREHRDEITSHLDQDVVLVCRSGQRAAEAEQALAAAGLRQAHILDGGMLAWRRVQGPVVLGRKPWALERQIRLVAGLLVLFGAVGGLVAPVLLCVAIVVGAGLIFAAISDTCMMAVLLARLPYNQDETTCDAQEIVAQLATGRTTSDVARS